ncbi:D-alanyl-D-alanine carboxypeptidase family protein [Thermosediminibacter litoriperuensis]|uniref:serine-type D-Ala-D-Ala carboxypeptidase n=1 Tax=Thermosediminibacter litoriperuensis TaxID=291989 RepID=A0A5S5B0G0_9FIRM|nr:D-alanyl-D-alanine carboxypeptidase family protein [Thermosediminibacter litoriperuensis]TYP59886.1 D-alanyl-D-alanine carboxypeptidase (penicillin-binding protein 5/6) [Thermosediminibacter litoriperuensis]
MLKKCVSAAMVIVILFASGFFISDSEAKESDLSLSARAYVLMDPVSGRILAEKNSDMRLPMASTTKIMTAIVALERGDLTSTVTVSRKAASVRGSSFHLEPGETMSLESMLYGLLLPSGNDAAIAIAEHIGGDVKTFVDMMNLKAREIGAENTHFKNPHGLDEPGHFTTARDLALITRYALNIPKFREIVSTKDIIITEGKHPRHIYNTNRLLRVSEEIDGVKTGYTGKAGRCLVATAERNGLRLLSVVLNAHDHFSNSLKLLNYGFITYRLNRLVTKNKIYTAVPVKGGIINKAVLIAGEDVALPMRDGEKAQIKFVVPPFVPAPVFKDQVVGEIHVFIEGVLVRRVPLLSIQDIRKKTFFDRFYRIMMEWVAPGV